MTDDQITRPIPEGDPRSSEPSSLNGLTMALGLDPAKSDQDSLLGCDVGGVTIVRLTAQGGMGRVYEGKQEKPNRTVAVKVMRPGLTSPSILKRFEYEAEVLGRLQHPGIAHIYSVGVHRVGNATVPYFVMEYIADARSLTQYADELKLPTRQRLDLFRSVCEAVAHGHQKGVIHRDLKPSNILVDASGQAKVIDFGVARVTDSDMALTTMQTDVGQLIGTLQYMSPEQFRADPNDIDVRSDVYALGVILYELLAGKMPYDLKKKAIAEIARTVQEDDPKPLSSFDRALKGDVAVIAGKCLEKERDRRYSSASEVGADIGRYLTGDPISASPPGFVDGLVRLARKHRGAAPAALGVFASLVAAVFGIGVFANRTNEALKQASKEHKSALAIAAFVRDDFLALTSVEGQVRFGEPATTNLNKDSTLRDLVDRAAKKLEERKDLDPLIEASLCGMVGYIYSDLSEQKSAIRFLERSFQLRSRHLGHDHPMSLESMNALAVACHGALLLGKALPLYTTALHRSTSVLGADHQLTLRVKGNLAVAYQCVGRHNEAEQTTKELLEHYSAKLGPEHPSTIGCKRHLATIYFFARKHREAIPYLEDVVQSMTKLIDLHDPKLLESMHDLAVLYHTVGQLDKALPLIDQAVERQNERYGHDHIKSMRYMDDLAKIYWDSGREEEAQQYLERLLETRAAKLGPSHRETLVTRKKLLEAYGSVGEIAKALPLFEQELAHRLGTLGAEHPDTLSAAVKLGLTYAIDGNVEKAILVAQTFADGSTSRISYLGELGVALLRKKRFPEAESALRRCLKALREKEAESWRLAFCESALGSALAGQGESEAAQPLLEESYRILRARQDEIPTERRAPLIRFALEALIKVADDKEGGETEAAAWREELSRWEAESATTSKSDELPEN